MSRRFDEPNGENPEGNTKEGEDIMVTLEEFREYCEAQKGAMESLKKETEEAKKEAAAAKKEAEEAKREAAELKKTAGTAGISEWDRVSPKPERLAVRYHLIEKDISGKTVVLKSFEDETVANKALSIAKLEGRKEPEVIQTDVWINTDGSEGDKVTLEQFCALNSK